jgi:hypothetical protein
MREHATVNISNPFLYPSISHYLSPQLSKQTISAEPTQLLLRSTLDWRSGRLRSGNTARGPANVNPLCANTDPSYAFFALFCCQSGAACNRRAAIRLFRYYMEISPVVAISVYQMADLASVRLMAVSASASALFVSVSSHSRPNLNG